MKKLMALTLAVAMILVCMPAVVMADVAGSATPAAANISNVYYNVDFEDAAYAYDADSDTDNHYIINTTNKATNNTVSFTTSGTTNYYRIKTDDTTYLAPNGRKQQIAYDMPMESAVYEEGKLVYVDFRIKRVSPTNDDPVTVYFVDSSNKEIFGINYTQNCFPTLLASTTIGTATSDASATDVTDPIDGNFHCIRAILDFDNKTFELYQGASFDSMTNFVEGVDTFNFKTATAANLSKITNTGHGNKKGSLGFDDIKVYTVGESAPAEPVITPDSGEAGEEGTTVVWGTATNVVASENGTDGEGNTIYSYESASGDAVEFGVQITDGEFAGFYPALGLKEGKFAIKFTGNAASDLLTQLYLKINGVVQE